MLTKENLEELRDNVPPDVAEHGALADVLVACTIAYCTWRQNICVMTFKAIRAELYQFTSHYIGFCNLVRSNNNERIKMDAKENNDPDAPIEVPLPTFRVPNNLAPVQIAYALCYCRWICRIPCAGEDSDEDKDLIAVYQTEGAKAGTYDKTDATLDKLIGKLKPGVTPKEINEVRQTLKGIVSRREPCQDKDLVAVNNGIFDYKAKQLLPFDPQYIFLNKTTVDYKENAQNVTIHNPVDGTDWDVESWIQELFDDPALSNLIWEVLGAVVRPTVSWNKCVFLLGPSGANGKGTLCELARNLCGGSASSIPLTDFGKNFMLEPLIGASANISDENDVGAYLDKAANFKAAVTGDKIQINRKNRPPVTYKFPGLVIQCLNDSPRVQDTSDSFYRRCLFVPFEKSYTGRERKYIKDDYMSRKEVLEYVLHRVLHMNCYSFSEPAVCHDALCIYKTNNDPIRQWWDEVSDKFIWDLLPFKFLFECFKHWSDVSNPSGWMQSRNVFIAKMRKIAEEDSIWMYPGTGWQRQTDSCYESHCRL